MAGVKISALQSVSSAQLTDVYPVVQTGITKKESISQLITLLNTNIQLASPSQVTGLSTLLGNYLPLAGGTMTGALLLNADPVLPLGAATKQYVDTVASGFTVILAAYAATTANLNTVYANGASGVGATLTDNAGTFAAFAVDGVSPPLNSRILVKNQTTTFQNGVYVLTTNGDGISVPYVLTRATDYDQAPSEIHPGTLVSVNNGTANAGSSWLETATVTTIGTDPILFSAFSFGPSSYLLKANNLSDVNSVSTSRTNLGLGTVATKTASNSGLTNAAMVSGATVIGNLASFVDVSGSIHDSGIAATFTGTGDIVLNNTPTLITPILGSATATTITFNPTTGGLVGTPVANNASAGIVGEFISSTVLSGAPTAVASTGTSYNVTQINLSAGDWDVWGNVVIAPPGGNLLVQAAGWISSTSATLPDTAFVANISAGTSDLFNQLALTVPYRRFSLSALTTIYISMIATFTGSNGTTWGGIYARRAR